MTVEMSGAVEDLVAVPLEGFSGGSVHRPLGQDDGLSGAGVEMYAVAELLTQPRADQQAVTGVDGEVAAVVEGVDV